MAAVLTTACERRRAPRVGALALGVLDSAVLRPGVPVGIVTVSLAGALVVSSAPVRPGARTDLALEAVAGERWVVAVLVVRCWVVAVSPLRYCTALEFEGGGPQGMGSGYSRLT